MEQIQPLARFPIITTNRIEQAEDALSRSLTKISIMKTDDRDRFHLEMNGVNLGRTSLVFNRFGTETKMNAGLLGESVLFVFGSGMPFRIVLEEGLVIVNPQSAAVVMPGKLKQIERTGGSEAFVLRTTLSELLQCFEELIAWHHRGSIIFDHTIDLTNGPGAKLRQTMNYLFNELEHNALTLKNPKLCKSYDDILLATLLSLPHNQINKLYEDRRYQVAPGIVRRAEEYMRAHLDEPISIMDLLRVCGCSRRTLFSVFRNARRYTPMEFLTEQRLQNVRDKLINPSKEASVASIASGCGFTHLGRFSQVYRKRFGERPSDTLRKGM